MRGFETLKNLAQRLGDAESLDRTCSAWFSYTDPGKPSPPLRIPSDTKSRDRGGNTYLSLSAYFFGAGEISARNWGPPRPLDSFFRQKSERVFLKGVSEFPYS